ncbi:hypothetical protein QR680_013785 [Steinernema hermaphroditum]|uniref:Fatty-acid and retinol-binding protein 1 n=1 Tax=Steinernema hermaphroditum TaxID=289476 RepID=A0AA39I999_9BILA|nr:hypothetical protein QR680_013785 [Steinernema hermaphroditum]
MYRCAIVVCFLAFVGLSHADGVNLPDLNEADIANIINKLPQEVKDFYTSLSDADIDALNKASQDISDKGADITFDQVLEILRKYSPTLADRAKRLNENMMAKVAQLSEPVKKFINDTVTKLTDLAMSPGENQAEFAEILKVLQGIVKEAFTLPDSAKVEVQRSFPETRELFNNPIVGQAARQFAQLTDQELQSAANQISEGMAKMEKEPQQNK